MENDDILRRKIARALFRPPSVSPSEAFVRRVMAVLPPEEAPLPAAFPFLRWLAPALSLAALTLVLAWPGGAGPLSAEALILADGADERRSAWAFEREEPAAGDLLAFVLEEP